MKNHKVKMDKLGKGIKNQKTNLTSEEKLLESLKLIYLAKELKKAALKKFNPKLTDDEVNYKVREIFLSART